MIAHFSSKLNKQVNAVFLALLLAICLLGTHWIGLNHGISHAGISKQAVCEGAPVAAHSSDICHLLDALTLAGFIPPSSASAPQVTEAQITTLQSDASQHDAHTLIAYQSQAPPFLIL